MTKYTQTAELLLWTNALGRAKDVLIDTNRNCVDRVNVVWRDLRGLAPPNLPPSWRFEWSAVAERADRLATAVAEPYTPARMDEAGDVGTIFLLIGWLLRRSIDTPGDLSWVRFAGTAVMHGGEEKEPYT